MIGAGLLVLLAVGALLVPDLRAEPGTWVVSGILLLLAVWRVVIGRPGGTLKTARQVKYSGPWGYGSHDGTGEGDAREKRGE